MTKLRAREAGGRGMTKPGAQRRSRQATSPHLHARLGASEAARRRAEESAYGARAELARLTRLISAGRIASWIAHEISQPIAAIVTNGDAALHWLGRDAPNLAEAREAIQRTIRDANRAVAVISGTRAMLSRDKIAFVDVDINQVLRDVILLSSGELRRSRVIVRTSLFWDLPPVNGDRILLEQVVLNLVLNGIDAMKAMDGRTRILTIRSGLSASGDILVAVKDCGGGFDPADADRLFDHFFTTKPEGLGLGLPISRSIIATHGGRLWASPGPSGGAVFQFTLPRSSTQELDA